jgi:hypothetical protein
MWSVVLPGAVRAKGAELAFHVLEANMRKAIMVMLSIAVAVIVTSQADAKGKKTTMGTIKFIKHYDKSSPALALRQSTRSTPNPTTSGSSQMKGRR